MIKPDTKPYTPRDVASFQRDAASTDPSLVPMDPYRVEASIHAAMVRGMDHQKEEDAEHLKREHRALLIAIWSGIVVALVLMFVVSNIVYDTPQSRPAAEVFDRGP